MATAGDGRSPYESGGAGEKFLKRHFQPDVYEEPRNVPREEGRNNSNAASEHSTHQGGTCTTAGISEVKQMLKQMPFTRSEIQDLMVLLQSRMNEESPFDIAVERNSGTKLPPPSSPSAVKRLEASSACGSLKKHKHGDEKDNFHAAVFCSRVVGEQIGSPAELANAYKGRTIGTGQAIRQDSELFNNNATVLPKTLKASPQHPSTMEKLPDELLLKIFIRLLAKQLAQMRSVSKSWNALLSQSSFIKSHLRCSIHYNDRILLGFYDEPPTSDSDDEVNENPSFSKSFSIHSCPPSDLDLTNFIKPPLDPRFENENAVRVIGSINGLICYSQ